MRIDEVIATDDILKKEYSKIIKHIDTKLPTHIDVGPIKNQILKSWKAGQRSRNHFQNLLKKHLDISLNDIL
jgi:hypothetical protein